MKAPVIHESHKLTNKKVGQVFVQYCENCMFCVCHYPDVLSQKCRPNSLRKEFEAE